MSSPSIAIVPEVGSIVRLIIRRLVVLPQPEGPTNTVISLVRSSIDRLSTATVPPGKALVTASNVIMELSGSSVPGPVPQRAGPLSRNLVQFRPVGGQGGGVGRRAKG